MSASDTKAVSEHAGIWKQILSESSRQSEELHPTTAIILGDRNCGKTSLLQALQKDQDEHITKGIVLDYSFINVIDDQSDDTLGCINVWQMEGQEEHVDLLRFALNEDNLENAVAVITLDLSEPWNLEKRLTTWLSVLRSHVSSLRLSGSAQKELDNKLMARFTSYKEPSKDMPTRHKASFIALNKSLEKASSGDNAVDDSIADEEIEDTPSGVEEELPANVLSECIGIPIIVVGCKSDVTDSYLSQQYHYTADHIDFIQQHLRRICLKCGASLIFVSSSKNINVELFREYLEHTLYGFDFNHTAQISDRDQIFVPLGWDSNDKIKLDFDTQRATSDENALFEDIIQRPSLLASKQAHNLENTEDFQTFLEMHKSTIERLDSIKHTSAEGDSPAPAVAAASVATPTTPVNPKPLLDTRSPASSPASPSVENSEAIENFFQSLLGKGDSPS